MEDRKISGQFSTPDSVSEIFVELARGLQFNRLLDPACGTANLLASVGALGKEIETVGIDINQTIITEAQNSLSKLGIRHYLKAADFLGVELAELGVFDLVVCDPPMAIKYRKKEIAGVRIDRSEAAFILLSLQLLRPDGYAIFVVPEGLLFNETNRYFREYISEKYSLEAVMSLPLGIFSPFAAIKASVLVFKNSKQTGKVFFAEYAEPQALKHIISNLKQHTSNKNLSQGLWVGIESIRNNEWVWAYSRFRGLEYFKEWKSNAKYPIKPLSELVVFGENKIETAETILIQRIGNNPKIILKSELPAESNRKNYIECTLKDESVLLEYLKLYLDSEQGRRQINVLLIGAVMPSLRMQDLEDIYIEVPSLAIQSDIIAMSQKLLEVSSRIQLVAKSFYKQPLDYANLFPVVKKFDQADDKDLGFEKLIWPLATSYRIATKGSPNVNSQLDSYFKMFEMVAAFNSIVLLSALRDEFQRQYEKEIWTEEKSKYAKVSFGLWVALYRRLAKLHTRLANETKDDESLIQPFPFGKEFYLGLSNKELLRILDTIPEKRNRFGGAAHGGIVPEIVAQKAVSELHPSLVTIFEKLAAVYSGLDLIYPQSMKKSNGLYTIKIKKLSGTHYPFSEEEIPSEIDMNTDALYLFNSASGVRLELLPEFIKLIQCELCGNWSVFFFSKTDDKKSNYVSYQNEIHGFEDKPSGILQSLSNA